MRQIDSYDMVPEQYYLVYEKGSYMSVGICILREESVCSGLIQDIVPYLQKLQINGNIHIKFEEPDETYINNHYDEIVFELTEAEILKHVIMETI